VRRYDWTRTVSARLSTPVLGVLVVCGGLACALEWYRFADTQHAAKFEPLSLTFFPEAVAQTVLGTPVDRALMEELDRREDAARASYVPGRAASRKNVVIIVVDALRPDHLSVNGYHRDTTPQLKRLLERAGARQIANVYAVCSRSACGLFSLMASRFVHRFPSRPFGLYEVLRRNAYKVHMILGGDHEAYYGLRKLYGEVDSYFDASMAAAGRYVNDDSIVLQRAAALPQWNGEPTMLQFHLMSAHPAGLRQERYLKYAPHRQYLFGELPLAQMREVAANYYDSGVLQADASIAELLRTLAEKRYLGNTLVVITADHGEALGENGLFTHGKSLSEEEVRIPLFMLAYGFTPIAFADKPVTSQADIAPTILAELGIVPPQSWDGVAVQTAIRRRYSYVQEWHTAGFLDQDDERSVWKYLVDLRTGEEFAYDLTRDPAARNNSVRSVDLKRRGEWREAFSEMGVGTRPGPARAGHER
jgi:glucan phosphoethanolaminetransferase (alkaline phosphatase superfamily)